MCIIYLRNMQPDEGCLLQPKHVVFYIRIENYCVKYDYFIVTYFIDTTELTRVMVEDSFRLL